jgi:hypothetical protein
MTCNDLFRETRCFVADRAQQMAKKAGDFCRTILPRLLRASTQTVVFWAA